MLIKDTIAIILLHIQLQCGCRTYNGYDINAEPGQNPQLKDGRGNICPVTIILPTLAMKANKDFRKFMELLDIKIDEAKDMLIERYNYIISQDPRAASFMYENKLLYGYDGKTIESAMKHRNFGCGSNWLS